MNLRTRLAALERASHRLGGFGRCETCGGSSPGMDPIAVADTSKSAEEHGGPALAVHLGRRCVECKLLVDENGRAFDNTERATCNIRRSITLVDLRGEDASIA